MIKNWGPLIAGALSCLCISCSQISGPALEADKPTDLPAVSGALPALPRAHEASGLTENLIFGKNTELRSAAVVDNGNAVDISPAGGAPDWAMYRFNTANPLDSVSVDLDSAGSNAYIGLANYGKGVWDLYGPFDERKTLLLDSGDYISPGSNLYCVVLASGGPAMVSALSVRTLNPANEAPVAALSALPLSGNAPLAVAFDASASSDADGTIIEYGWDWDSNGGYEEITDLPQIDHVFGPGLHDVRVRVKDDQFDRDIALIQIDVSVAGNLDPEPKFALNPATGDAPLNVDFNASASSDPDGEIVRYDWDLDGDGLFEIYDGGTTNFSHLYTNPGVYTVQLRATDDLGAQAIETHDVTVTTAGNSLPSANFSVTPQQDILPLSLKFAFDGSTSSDSDGSILRYDWDFDNDGNWDLFDGPASPAYSLNRVGTFQPLLRVVDNGGGTDTYQKTIYSPSIWSSVNGQPGKPMRQSPVVAAQDNTIKWSYIAPDAIHSSPAITADGNIVFGCYDKKVYCVMPNGTPTPTLKWSFATGDQIHSSPAVGPNGEIYIGSDDGTIYALADNGTSEPSLLWSYVTGSTVLASPVVGPDGTVYVGCGDGTMFALVDNGSSTPTVKWSYLTGGEIDGAAAFGADGTVYVCSYDHRIFAFQDNGSDTPNIRWTYDTGEAIVSTPAIGPDGLVYIANINGTVFALEDNGTATPDLKWSYTTGSNINSSPAIGPGGNVYIGSMDHKVYALADNGTATPTVKWTYDSGNLVNSSPAVASDGTVYVGCVNTAIVALHGNGTPTPQMKWFYNTSFAIWSSPAIGPDGTVYIGNHAGELIAFGQ